MTAKLLYQLDTDWTPSVFDSVVAFDGGADHVIGHPNITPDNVGSLVDGAIFTRGGKEKSCTALFVGGGNMQAGEAVLDAGEEEVLRELPRVGDAGQQRLEHHRGCRRRPAREGRLRSRARRRWCIAGTGPVGMRTAALLAQEGANVTITGRQRDKTEAAAQAIQKRFGVQVEAVEAASAEARDTAIRGAQIVCAAGAIGQELVSEQAWTREGSVEMVADYNAQPPLGLGGIGATDKGKEYGGKLAFGALGIGGLKLKLHRACIARLFERNDQVLDAEEIYRLAKDLA